jgi:hypothetical protein
MSDCCCHQSTPEHQNQSFKVQYTRTAGRCTFNVCPTYYGQLLVYRYMVYITGTTYTWYVANGGTIHMYE